MYRVPSTKYVIDLTRTYKMLLLFISISIFTFSGDEHTMVAIKTLKSSVTQEAIRNFEYEAEVMADIRHENIVMFFGICYKEENIMMIFEYMEQGDLNNFLRYSQ